MRSASLCQTLGFPQCLVSHWAVTSAQGCLCLPSWLGRKGPVPQGAELVLGRCRCMWTRGLASSTPALSAAAGMWRGSAASCLGCGKSFGSQNQSEVQLSPSPLPPKPPSRSIACPSPWCVGWEPLLQQAGRGGWGGAGGNNCVAVCPCQTMGATLSALMGSQSRMTPFFPTSLPRLFGRAALGSASV